MTKAADQLQFFRTRFGKKPSRLEEQEFQEDLSRLNLDFMQVALLETAAIATRQNRPPRDVRRTILDRYERLVALDAQLFPVFFIFESAWRTVLAGALDAIYGADDWWHPVRDAVERGADTAMVNSFNGIRVAPEVVRTLNHILGKAPGALANVVSTYDLLELATLFDIGKLIERHWSDLTPVMNAQLAGGPPRWAAFDALFRRIRHARNAAFHHRVVADRAAVAAAAERLLDVIDVHLGARVLALQQVVVPPLQFSLFKEPRHR